MKEAGQVISLGTSSPIIIILSSRQLRLPPDLLGWFPADSLKDLHSLVFMMCGLAELCFDDSSDASSDRSGLVGHLGYRHGEVN